MASTTCTCGAMLPEPDSMGLVTCLSCGRVSRVDASADPPASSSSSPGVTASEASSGSGSQAWPAPPVIAPDPGSGTGWVPPTGGGTPASLAGIPGMETVQKVTKVGKGCALIATIVTVAAIVGTVILVISVTKDAIDRAKSYGNDITLSGSTRVLAQADGNPSDVVAVVQSYRDGSTHRYLARLDVKADGFTERWRSPEIPDDAYDPQVAVVGDTMFAGLKDQLWALSAGTGKQRWQTTLPDSVTNACDDCFVAVEGTLVIRTNDAYLRAFRPESGEPLWSRRLTATTAKPSATGGHLYVTDDSPEAGLPARVHTIDPATGRDRRSFTPSCPRDERNFDVTIDAGDQVRAVPGSKDLVALFGFGSACVVRWEAVTNTVRYASRVPDVSPVTDLDDVVMGSKDLVAPTSSGLMRVDLANGRVTPMPAGLDQTVAPGPIVGRVMIARTTSTRGTTRGGIAGYSLDTGRRLWAVAAPGGAQPASDGTTDALFDGQLRYVVAVDGETARLVVFDGKTAAATIDTIDVRTGTLSGRRSVQLGRRSSGTPSLGVDAVGNTRLLFTIDNLLESLDVRTGVIHTHPAGD